MFLWIKQIFQFAHCKKSRKGKTPIQSRAGSENWPGAAVAEGSL